jgi:hypothetical protein
VWRVLVVASLTIAGTVQVGLYSDRAFACSRGEFDPVSEGDVIVEGRYVRYEASPNPMTTQVVADPKTGEDQILVPPPSVTETVQLEVNRVFKGSAGPAITIVNHAYVEPAPSGSCGGVASDPTGKYTVTALLERDDGAYSYYYTLFVGDSASGESYDRAVVRLETALGPGTFPAAGYGPPQASRGVAIIVASLAAIGVALATAALCVRSEAS